MAIDLNIKLNDDTISELSKLIATEVAKMIGQTEENVETTLLSVKELAKYIHYSERNIMRMVYDGKLPFIKEGKHTLFYKKEIDELLKKNSLKRYGRRQSVS